MLVLLVLSSATVFAAGAQQSSEAELRLDTPSFVFARYATASAASLYGARGFGPVGGFVGVVQNPQTQYRELIAGIHTQVNWDRQSVLVALGYARCDGERVLADLRHSLALSGAPDVLGYDRVV